MKSFSNAQSSFNRKPQTGKTKAQLIAELRHIKVELNQSRQDRATDLLHITQQIRESYVLSGQQAQAHFVQMNNMIGLLNVSMTKALIYTHENSKLAHQLGVQPRLPLNERAPIPTCDRELLGFFYHEFSRN